MLLLMLLLNPIFDISNWRCLVLELALTALTNCVKAHSLAPLWRVFVAVRLVPSPIPLGEWTTPRFSVERGGYVASKMEKMMIHKSTMGCGGTPFSDRSMLDTSTFHGQTPAIAHPEDASSPAERISTSFKPCTAMGVTR